MGGGQVSGVLVEREASSALTRSVNQGLMVTWINRDLTNRFWADVEKSIVFYDADGLFETAGPAELELTESLQTALYDRGVRSWSKGIV